MKADPFAQLKLLDIAEIDGRLAQLNHHLAHLPQDADIATAQAERRTLVDKARDLRIRHDDLTVVLRKAEADVETVRTRRDREQARIDGGQVGNPRDLERLGAELAAISRRISVLEDEELEVMEQVESVAASLGELETQIAEVDARIAELEAKREERAAELREQISAVRADRPAAVEGMPEDLVALYERLREQKGSGAAELRARQCGGCRLSLDAAEIGRIRALASNEVVRCSECGRILVRTSESGL